VVLFFVVVCVVVCVVVTGVVLDVWFNGATLGSSISSFVRLEDGSCTAQPPIARRINSKIGNSFIV
jgi:hypothetical protein